MRDSKERLLDIIEAINKIKQNLNCDKDKFEDDEFLQVWVVHHLIIIGEACRVISEGFKINHPEIPWREINDMRNILVHLYFGIDYDLVWNVINNDIPKLESQIKDILKKER